MIDGKNLFYQPIKNDLKTYDNFRKIAAGIAVINRVDVYEIIPIPKNTMN